MAQWRSDKSGEIVEYQENEEYRASPGALGWPEPSDAVDAAVQLAVTGYGPGEDVWKALSEADLGVYVQPSGMPLVAVSPDGHPVVPAFTSQAQLDVSGSLGFVVMPTADLLAKLPEGVELYLNAAGPTPLRMENEPLLRALAELSSDEEEEKDQTPVQEDSARGAEVSAASRSAWQSAKASRT